jgi:hypothetical protein
MYGNPSSDTNYIRGMAKVFHLQSVKSRTRIFSGVRHVHDSQGNP